MNYIWLRKLSNCSTSQIQQRKNFNEEKTSCLHANFCLVRHHEMNYIWLWKLSECSTSQITQMNLEKIQISEKVYQINVSFVLYINHLAFKMI